METKELSDLINIRNYVSGAIGNFSIDRKTISELNGMLILIDKKILSLIQGNDFKEYIDYKNIKKAIQEVVEISNIKSAMKFKQK